MKYLHFFLPLICLTFFTPFNSLLAQDGDEEGDAAPAEGGGDTAAGGGDAAPAEGGGDTAAGGGDATPAAAPAPAAGGDSGGDAGTAPAAPAAAPAPAAGGEAAAAPAPAAPAPAAPAPAPAVAAPAPPPAAPAFDMGAAFSSSAGAAPPPEIAADSNPVLQVVVLTGGEFSLDDAATTGISVIQQMAANPVDDTGFSLDQLKRNIQAKAKVAKAFQDGGDLKAMISKAINLKKDQLEAFQSGSRQDIVKMRANTAEGITFSIDKLDEVAAKAKVIKSAKDQGKVIDDSVFTEVNKMKTDELELFKDASLDQVASAFNASGGTLNSDGIASLVGVGQFVAQGGGSFDDFAGKDYGEGFFKDYRDPDKAKEAVDSGYTPDSLKEAADSGVAPPTPVLLDANNKPVVLKVGDRYVWAPDLKGRELHAVWGIDESNGDIGMDKVSLTATNYNGQALRGNDGASDADGFSMKIEVFSDSVIKVTEYFDDGTTVDEVVFFKVIRGANGEVLSAALEFENPVLGNTIDNDELNYININTESSKALINKLSAAKNLTELPTGVSPDLQLFGKRTDADNRYNQLFDATSSTVLTDQNGKPLVVRFASNDEDHAYTYQWARSLDGAELQTASNRDGVVENRIITISGNTATWKDENGETETATIEIFGSVIRSVETTDEGNLVSFHKIAREGESFRIITLEFQPGTSIDYDLIDSLIWDNRYLNENVTGFLGSGADPSDKEFLYGNPTDALNQKNLLSSIKGFGAPASLKRTAGYPQSGGPLTDSSWTAFDTYLKGLHDNTQSSIDALAPAISLLERTMLNRTINGGDLDDVNHAHFKDFLTLSELDSEDVPSTYLQLVAGLANVGTIDPSGDLTSVKNYINVINGKNENYWNNDMTAANFSVLLDEFLGSRRGWLSNNFDSRSDDFSRAEVSDPDNSRGLTYNLDIDDPGSSADGVAFKVLSGHNNYLSGKFTDSTHAVPSPGSALDKVVDVTIITSARDTVIGVPGQNGVEQTFEIDTPDWEPGRPQADEDAYVISAGDELYLREPWTTNEAHYRSYANPAKMNIEIDHSSLALAAVDAMNLVNVDITTGGGLAVASLDELNIWATNTSDPNVFTVGEGGNDFESLYLYAGTELNVKDLVVTGRVDDVYMEATTINLTNVTFPANSSVLFRSEAGNLRFLNESQSWMKNAVNVRNVVHQGIDATREIRSTDFVPTSLGSRSSKDPSRTRPYIEVQRFTRNAN